MNRIIAALAVVGLLSGVAVATDSAFAAEKKTSKVQKKESKRPNFKNCDTNNDDVLSLEEFVACYPQVGEERFKTIDTDNNGKVTREEMREFDKKRGDVRKRAFFDECDKDKDGKLSFEEFDQCQPQRNAPKKKK